MDSSNPTGVNSTHLPQQQQYHNGSFSHFINDVDAYAHDDPISTNDDFSNFPWDPALFAGGDSNSGFQQQQQQQQQPQPMQANLNQTLTRQSNSPALQPRPPAHAHQQYPQNSYGHSMFDHRNMAQPSFDDRFMSRPSALPTSFDPHQSYQQMPYGNYPYQQAYHRQISSPSPFYAQSPVQQPPPQQQSMQQPQQMMGMNVRQPSQLSQTPQMDNIQMHQFPNNRVTHTFVNPSMVNSSHMVAMNGSPQQNSNAVPRPQYQPSPYFQKPGSNNDQSLLHGVQMQNYQPMSAASQQQMLHHASASQPPQSQPQASMQSVLNQPATVSKATPQSKDSKDSIAPKRSKPKLAKVKKENTAEAESSDDLEVEDEPPEVKPALLVVSQPTDEKGKALYNAVEAVWYPRNKSPQAEDIRKGIAAFGETVRALRDAWKAKNDSLKKAELSNSDNAPEFSKLKEDVAHYRQTMEGVMLRSLQYGHDAIVKRLGENQFTLSALYSFLFDRTNNQDYESTLVNSIFKFAVKFETLDEEMLEKVKWSKVLQRWAKKATNDSKDFAQKILNNASNRSAIKKSDRSEVIPGSPSSVNGSKRDSVAGVKRPRDGEMSIAPAPKKIVKPASKPLALQSAERRKALEKESLMKAAGKVDKGLGGGSSTVATRPKVAMVPPPKANSFASLISASKKPGTSNAEKAAAAAATKDKPSASIAVLPANELLTTIRREELKKESPPRTLGLNTAKSASSFLGFLADMDKPKETETKKIEADPNETEEQRAKRVRKEARKKLRVTWKPDNDLVQVKMFTHDPEEETGQTHSMMRDAGDTMKEGEMLKRHMEKDEDEEDEDEAVLDDFDEYSPPSMVDFSGVDTALNYAKFGGPGKPESPGSDAQAKYEENTLMTTYTFSFDRPETPKELPSINDEDDFQPEADFGEPGDKVRIREREIIARKQPRAPPAASNDLAAQLRALGMQQPQTAGTFNPYSQPAHPQPQPQPAALPMTGVTDLANLFAIVQQVKQLNQAQAQPQPQPQPQPQQTMYQPPTSAITPDIAAVLAQVNGQQNQSLPLGSAGNPNPFPGNDDNNRKHGRDEGGEQPSKKKKKGGDGKPYNYKTIVCSFWQEGKCTKGDNCTYKHEL